ncbi:unnamed protein product, partial [Staurois parvus]
VLHRCTGSSPFSLAQVYRLLPFSLAQVYRLLPFSLAQVYRLLPFSLSSDVTAHWVLLTMCFRSCSQLELRLISWLEDVQHHLAFNSPASPAPPLSVFQFFQSASHVGVTYKNTASLETPSPPVWEHPLLHSDICITPPTACIRAEGS